MELLGSGLRGVVEMLLLLLLLFSWPGESGPGMEPGTSVSLVTLRVRLRGDLGDALSLENGRGGVEDCFFAERSESLTLGEKMEDAVGGGCWGVVDTKLDEGVVVTGCCDGVWLLVDMLGLYRRQGDRSTGEWELFGESDPCGCGLVRARLNLDGDRDRDRLRLLTEVARTST